MKIYSKYYLTPSEVDTYRIIRKYKSFELNKTSIYYKHVLSLLERKILEQTKSKLSWDIEVKIRIEISNNILNYYENNKS